MNDGEIYNNHCNYEGAGFQIHNSSTFTMNGGRLYNNTSNARGGVLWVNNSSKFIMTGGIITGNKTNGATIYLASSTLTFSGSAQFYGNYSGSTPQDVTSRFTVGGAFTSARIGISTTGTFTTNYGKFNPDVSASKYFYATNTSYHAGDTVAALGSTNEGSIVSGAQTANKIVWKYRYGNDSEWKLAASALTNGDQFAVFAQDSYLALKNPSRSITILPFESETATTPLVASMSELVRNSNTGKDNYTECAPSVIDYKTGVFNLRYDGEGNYLNSTFTLAMQLSIIFIDVKASKIEYTGAYQNGILFNPNYLDYEILSTPLDASAVKASGEYLQFLSTGTYKIKLKFKSEYADQIEAGLVGWAKTDWTEALENKESIEIEFTVAKGSLALPEAESKVYDAKAWTLSDAVGEWCSEAHCNENVVELRKVEYKNFASGAAYAGISKENIIKAGYYRITLVVKDKHNYMWSDTTDGEKSFDLTINKAEILMNQPRVDEYGILADGERITAKSGILPTDAGAMNADGVYGLEYIAKGDVEYDTWTRSAPENAGEYYVRPYIVSPDDCNYEIDYQITNNVGTCYTLFERLKNTIAIPFLWKEGASIDNSTYTTSTPYTGAKQTFKLVNTKADDDSYYLSEGIEVASMEGGIAQTDASTFEATNMQTYKV
ncbi:MAG: right-handed parallel beta-helix repeat-containing protein, partial [Clostridia bacterium]|nr:right-handed parallel beta-helix repeat-containing protein [Clostridia bacterium]